MKKFLFASLLAVFLALPAAVQAADEYDVAKISCKEFLASGDEMGMLLVWIDGYMSAKSDNTVMSSEWMEKLGSHLGSYCKKNSSHTIMQAIEAMPAN